MLTDHESDHMKTIVFSLLGMLLIIGFPHKGNAQAEFQPGLGIAMKASTNGLGGDLVYGLHPKLNLRLGIEMFGYDRDVTFSEQNIDYEAVVDIRIGGISLLCDYSLSPWFFITGGAAYNLFHSEVIGHAVSSMPFGDIEIPKEMIGGFQFDFDPNWRISPYLGIGFGRTMNHKKRIGFAFELGSFYQGPPDISIQSTGLLSPTSNPDHGQEDKLERQIDQYFLYPLLRFSLSYRIIQFD